MTVICRGGTSSTRPGVTETVLVASGFIAQLLEKYAYEWLKAGIPLLTLPPYETATFCTSDPPAQPTLTADETNAIINLEFGANFTSGLAKLRDLIANRAWRELCVCDDGLPPDAVTPQTPPAGTAQVNNLVGVDPTPCFSFDSINASMTSGTHQFTSNGDTVGKGFYETLRLRMTYLNHGGVLSRPTHYQVVLFSRLDAQANLQIIELTPTTADVQDFFIPTGPLSFGYKVNVTVPFTTTDGLSIRGDGFCAPGVTTTQPGCCPPDQELRDNVQALLSLVTLIQRQSVPFAFVDSTVHAGLTGTGVLDISGLLGARVVATTIPDHFGRSGTTPTEYFDLGFITFGAGDAYPSAFRLERSTQLFLPPRCSAFTELAYDLAPGVVVTITELLREP